MSFAARLTNPVLTGQPLFSNAVVEQADAGGKTPPCLCHVYGSLCPIHDADTDHRGNDLRLRKRRSGSPQRKGK